MSENILNSKPESTPAEVQMAQLLTYARQTRSATVFIAWMIGIGVAISLILGIIVGIQTDRVANELSNNGSSSNCQSQGGTNPNC
jgi:hypothetical protein